MPLEPDNQIERVLKAYAKKRREEAGASFDMPAATRRLLQTEVARQRPKPDAGSPSFLQLLVSFWPRAAFAAALLVVLGLLIWVAAPVQNSRQELAKNVSQRVENLSTAEQKSKDASAKPAAEPMPDSGETTEMRRKNLRPQSSDQDKALDVVSAPVVVPPSGSSSALTTNALGLRGDPAQSGLAMKKPLGTESFARDSKLALNGPVNRSDPHDGLSLSKGHEEETKRASGSPPSQPNSDLTLAFGANKEALARQLETPKTPSASGAVKQAADSLLKKSETVDQPQAANTLPSVAQTSEQVTVARQYGRDAAKVLNNERVRFSQITETRKAGGQPRSEGTLLNSFEVEQNGNRIRIYDADGSVYEGQVAASPGAFAGGAVALSEPGVQPASPINSVGGKTKLELNATEAEKLQAARRTPQLNDEISQNSSFQATGTSRTLNQLVVINGTLISAAEVDAKSDANAAAPRESQAAKYFKDTAPAPATPPVTRSRLLAPSPSSGVATSVPGAPSQQRLPVTPTILRIQGSAKVGVTKEVEINAIPAPR